jgi:hypothetical protein
VVPSARTRAVLCAGAIAAACAGGTVPRNARPGPQPADAGTMDAHAPAATAPLPAADLPPPLDEYPLGYRLRSYLEGFREEAVDVVWAAETAAVIRKRLLTLDRNVVRARLLECRCSACMLGFVATDAAWRDAEPMVDYPYVRWSGYEKHYRDPRPDGWWEGLIFLGRHPKDSPASAPRVRSYDAPWTDPACNGAFPYSPTWDSMARFPYSGVAINRMFLGEGRMNCACICGKIRTTDLSGCMLNGANSVSCRVKSATKHDLPVIEGDWSCPRAAPSGTQ